MSMIYRIHLVDYLFCNHLNHPILFMVQTSK